MNRHRRQVAALGLGCALLLAAVPTEAATPLVNGLTPLLGTLATAAALLLMRDSLAGLDGAMLPLAAIVLALAAARFCREGAAPRWLAGVTRRRARRSPFAVHQRACVEPAASLCASFDQREVLRAARHRFVELQAAWDARDLDRLRAWTTPEMLDELLGERPGDDGDRTEVLALHAELLGFEQLAGVYLASVEFSGTIRESLQRDAAPFREVWMLTRPVAGSSDWRLARQQTLF